MFYRRSSGTSLWETLRSVKDTSQDAATTSKVKTALLLSKHVSAFDIKATTSRGEVTLTGEVPTEETRRLAGAIAQDTSGVAQVRNNLTVNPGAERNADMANLGERVADLEIKTIVLDQLAQHPELKDKRLTVQVTKRIVTLDGTVDSPAQKRAAEQIAIQVLGVQGLAGQLMVTNTQTTPESADDKLARRVEFELYSTKAVSLKTVQGPVSMPFNVFYNAVPSPSRSSVWPPSELGVERCADSADLHGSPFQSRIIPQRNRTASRRNLCTFAPSVRLACTMRPSAHQTRRRLLSRRGRGRLGHEDRADRVRDRHRHSDPRMRHKGGRARSVLARPSG